MRWNSVRLRLMAWNIAVLAVVLIAFGWVVRYRVQDNLIDGLDQAMARPTRGLADYIANSPGPGFPPFLGGFRRGFRDGAPPGGPRFGPPPGGGGFRGGPGSTSPPGQNGPQGPPPVQAGQGTAPPPGQGAPTPSVGNAVAQQPAGTGSSTGSGQSQSGGRTEQPNRNDFALYDLTAQPIPPWTSPLIDAPLYRESVAGASRYETVQLDGHAYRVFSMPVFKGGQVIGVIESRRSLDDIYAEIDAVTKTLLTLAPWALILAGFVGIFLTDRMLRQVRQIGQTAERIEAHNLSGRLPVIGNDEFSDLARTINSMLARLENSFVELEGAYEQQKRFTADASHELRTPLTVIKANTSMALATASTVEELRHALQEADTAVDRTNRLVQDLLLLAKSDSNQIKIQRESVNVRDLFEHTIEMVRTVKSGDGSIAAIEMAPFPTGLCVDGDYEMLVRLFGNLLSNAVRHTPPEGKVTLSAKVKGKSVVLSVADTGEGIAPEHLSHIGERFYRVDPSRSNIAGGVGLGVAISKSIADAHSSKLEFASVLGSSTTVSIALPRAADD